MNKSNLIKLFSILLISMMVVMFTICNVYAANAPENFTDITNTINTNNTNTNSANTNTNRNNTNVNSNRANTNSNSSFYSNTNNLPQTGIEDSVPVALLVVVFGISAVYAYKKINEYKNI